MTATGAPTKRIGGIDIGSNTTRLIVADVWVDERGTLRHSAIARETTITRLAEGVDARGILLPVAIARTRNALVDYRQQLREAGAVFALATATSAVRDADNGEAFLGEIEHDFGFRTLLLDGGDEAQTTWSGVTSDPRIATLAAQGEGLLLDIGGGSTEIVRTRAGQVTDAHSFQLGSVRLTEQVPLPDAPGRSAVQAMVDRAREAIAAHSPEPAPVDLALGVAGTVTTAAMLGLGLHEWQPDAVHGSTITPGQVDGILEQLASLPLDERRRVPGLESERAPVILGGLAILLAALDHFHLDGMRVSVHDILDGIALRAGRIALDEHLTELPEPAGRTSC